MMNGPVSFSTLPYGLGMGSALKPAFSTAFLTTSPIRLSVVCTVRILSGLLVSTFQPSTCSMSFRKGVTVATQPPHLIVVLKLSVSIVLLAFYLFGLTTTRQPFYGSCLTVSGSYCILDVHVRARKNHTFRPDVDVQDTIAASFDEVFISLNNFTTKNLWSAYNLTVFKRRLFVTTDTELRAIAAPAIIGLSRKPLTGYNKPAASGMPIRL